jgi:DNA (cytosine-5)-methyltransferase 1
MKVNRDSKRRSERIAMQFPGTKNRVVQGCPPSDRTRVQVIDLFCGCGGMSYGFASARTQTVQYEICGGIDIDEHACATYKRMLGVSPLCDDITSLLRPEKYSEALGRWGVDADQPLVLIGCAPCQGFSSHRKKDPRLDDRNSLLLVFAKIACSLMPDLIVMENVPEVFAKQHWSHFSGWQRAMAKAGYTFRAKIYNLAQFGVPQERFRAVVIASRNWRHFRMPKPKRGPEDFATVREAISGLRPLAAGGVDPLDPMHITSKHRRETVDLIKLIPLDGGSHKSLPPDVGPACLHNVDGFRDVYGRLAWDKPAVAITGRCRTPSCGRYIHPDQHRGLSVREAALLQGFPPKFMFEGPFDDKYKQIGNAVSPIFARAVAEHLDLEWRSDHTVPLQAGEFIADVTGPNLKSFSSSIASIKRKMREAPTEALFPA